MNNLSFYLWLWFYFSKQDLYQTSRPVSILEYMTDSATAAACVTGHDRPPTGHFAGGWPVAWAVAVAEFVNYLEQSSK